MKLIKLFLLLLILSSNVYAASISGRVVDLTTNEPVGDSKIIINQESGKNDTVFANIYGNWAFDFLTSNVNENSRVPKKFHVEQNYPNPFNPSTHIRFVVNEPGDISIVVHNMLGQKVDERTKFLDAGHYSIEWQSKGASGVYFYTISNSKTTVTKKMLQLDGGFNGGLSEIRTGSMPSISFAKAETTLPVQLVISKFGYIADTVETEVSDGDYFENYIETIHHHALVIDLHNDILERMADNPWYHLADYHNYYHTDIPRLKQGGVDIQFFANWVDELRFPNELYDKALEYISLMNTEFGLNPDDIQQAFNPNQALDLVNDGKIAGVLGVEGGYVIENSLEKLDTLYQKGMRYMTITWNYSTDWAVSAKDGRSKTVGLSEFGNQVIRTMDSLGIIIDVSHTGVKTIEDILDVTKNPIVATHSGVWELREHYRNLTDDQIKAIAESGGVIGVVFYPYFLSYSSSSVNINTVIKHIDHIVDLVGIDYVALGSDFDGINTVPHGLENVSKFPDLTLALLEHGYSRKDVEKILGLNFMRVFHQVCSNK